MVTDHDEGCVRSELVDVLQRIAEVGLDDDGVRVTGADGDDELRLGVDDRDDIETARPERGMDVADFAGGDDTEPLSSVRDA